MPGNRRSGITDKMSGETKSSATTAKLYSVKNSRRLIDFDISDLFSCLSCIYKSCVKDLIKTEMILADVLKEFAENESRLVTSIYNELTSN